MPEEFFIELVQDIPGASVYELKVLGKLHDFSIVWNDERFALIRGEWKSLLDAAFVKRVSKILKQSDSLETIEAPILPDGRFYVRFVDKGNCHDANVEPQIGTLLNGTGRISFKNPDFVIRAYHYEKWYVCLELYSGGAKEFEKRRAPMRPFFSPISIDPRHARFMVNASETRPGETVMDPFCGTGGIMLEAGLLKRKVIGNDWALQMSTGAALNLKYYGIRDYSITNRDFLALNQSETVDAIVTDLPYGRNSRLSQKDIVHLYRESFRKFRSTLKENGICVVVVSREDLLNESEPFFEVIRIFPYRIHRSLTRYFAILRRKT